MKKLAFRFTATCGCPIPYPRWQDIAYFPGVTVNENDVIEFAYAAPVVTEAIGFKVVMHYERLLSLGQIDKGIAMKAAITAALDPDNAN